MITPMPDRLTTDATTDRPTDENTDSGPAVGAVTLENAAGLRIDERGSSRYKIGSGNYTRSVDTVERLCYTFS